MKMAQGLFEDEKNLVVGDISFFAEFVLVPFLLADEIFLQCVPTRGCSLDPINYTFLN
jgi:hypothetical protein